VLAHLNDRRQEPDLVIKSLHFLRRVLYVRAGRMRQFGFLALMGSMIGHSALAHSAAAEPLMVSLDYKVDKAVLGCPTRAEFERRIASEVRYDPFRDDADLQLSTQIYRVPAGLEAELLWTRKDGSREGERRLSSGNDCVALARGMSFAVAVQLQLLSAVSAEGNPNDAPPAPAPAPKPHELGAQRSAPREQPKAPLRAAFLIGLGPIAALGAAPAPSAGGRIFARAGFQRVDLELAGEAQLPVSYQTAPAAGFVLKSVDLTLAPCVRGGAMRVCAVAAAGRSRVEGFGVEAARRATATTLEAGVRLGFDQRLTSVLSFGAHADGLVRLTPVTVYLRSAPVWTMPILALKIGIDVAMHFQ
jgi:hypothetical protein